MQPSGEPGYYHDSAALSPRLRPRINSLASQQMELTAVRLGCARTTECTESTNAVEFHRRLESNYGCSAPPDSQNPATPLVHLKRALADVRLGDTNGRPRAAPGDLAGQRCCSRPSKAHGWPVDEVSRRCRTPLCISGGTLRLVGGSRGCSRGLCAPGGLEMLLDGLDST